MQEKTKLSDHTIDELIIKKKKLKSVVIGLGIVMFLACSTLIYLALKNGNYALITVAICCLVTTLPSIIALKKFDKEIKSKKQ